MKIKTASQPEPQGMDQPVTDLTQIFLNLQQQHRNVYVQQIEDQVFMFRPLGRSEYKQLAEDENFNDFQKEEILCQACTVWPENFDFEECSAGIPTVLAKTIMKNSFLDSIDSRIAILSHCRQEMFDLDNQITCIINEAFPQFDIEEIEKWDIAKTAKYLSRAEWKLTNLRGMNMVADPFVAQQEQEEQPQQNMQPRVQTQEVEEDSPIRRGEIETVAERQARLAGKTNKEKLTPEKLRELQAKFPEIYGNAGNIVTTVDGMQDSVDQSSPALRPGW